MFEIRVPKLCEHKTKGLAYVRGPGGKFAYIGRIGDSRTASEYRRFALEYIANDGWPPNFSFEKYSEDAGHTIGDLLDSFAAERKMLGGRNYTAVQIAERVLREVYRDLPTAEFSGRTLQRLIITLGKSGIHTRKQINAVLSATKRLLRHGVMAGLVLPEIFAQCSAVEGLRANSIKGLRESKKRMPVSEEHVMAVAERLPPTLKAVILLMWHTGCRPSEALTLTPGRIDRSGPVWEAAVSEHKTEHLGKTRTLYIGRTAQGVITPFLFRDPDAPMFNPRESIEQRAKNSPKGMHRRPDQKPSPRQTGRTVRDCYDFHGLRKAVQRVCDDIGIPRWSPYQIRHSYATRIRSQFGIDGSQVLLGHSSPNVTAIYAHNDEEKARAIVAAMG